MPTEQIRINDNLSIPLAELELRFSRSSGPGGQNVNRTASRVELLFDVAHTESLNEWQRQRVLQRLQGYIDQQGILHLVSQETPSQWRNRVDVVARFRQLLASSLHVQKRRIPTRPSRAARERRLTHKRRQSLTKSQRGRVQPEE